MTVTVMWLFSNYLIVEKYGSKTKLSLSVKHVLAKLIVKQFMSYPRTSLVMSYH